MIRRKKEVWLDTHTAELLDHVAQKTEGPKLFNHSLHAATVMLKNEPLLILSAMVSF